MRKDRTVWSDAESRGLAIYYGSDITRRPDGSWRVPSQSNPSRAYTVRYSAEDQSCGCEAFKATAKTTRLWCKHIYGLYWLLEHRAGRLVPNRSQIVRRSKQDFPRDWTPYKKAKARELPMFREWLFELCRHLPESDPSPQGGRPRIRVADLVFAAVYRVYEKRSVVEMDGHLRDLCEMGFISRVPEPNTVLGCFSSPDFAHTLKNMIRWTTKSPEIVETKVTADATVFSLPRYNYILDDETRRFSRKRDTVFAHIMAGVTTHIIFDVRVTFLPTQEKNEFPHLLEETAKRQRVLEVLGDTAYCNHDNFAAVEDIGAVAYFDFRKDATGWRAGAFGRAFDRYRLHKNKYMAHLSLRANAESVHSMLDRRFTNFMWSKADTAIVNEILCRCLIHNLCCWNVMYHLLDIEPEFGDGEVLPFESPAAS